MDATSLVVHWMSNNTCALDDETLRHVAVAKIPNHGQHGSGSIAAGTLNHMKLKRVFPQKVFFSQLFWEKILRHNHVFSPPTPFEIQKWGVIWSGATKINDFVSFTVGHLNGFPEQ
jgi:hypothetical protein